MAAAQTMKVEFEPIVLLPFVEHDLEEAEPKRDEQETDPVDLEPAPQMLGAFAAQGFRLVDEQVRRARAKGGPSAR